MLKNTRQRLGNKLDAREVGYYNAHGWEGVYFYMSTTAQTIVQRLWNYCNLLRDDGMSYGDYVEQLTSLLFLKMAYERTQSPYNQPSRIPKEYDWQSLVRRDGDELEAHYRHTLEELGKQPGMLGLIFRKAQNKIQDPAKLRRLIVDLIGRETWTVLDIDVKGDAYEGLLQKNAEDTKSGAGQYFTPRPPVVPGASCSPRTTTLCITPSWIAISGRKSSVTFANEEGREERDSSVIVRDDFWATTSNKQLNFVQHVRTLLKIHGRAAVVVPDNVLFEGGAGEVVRRKLLQECDVHTLLRLPTGIFYAQGVKANVLFFDRKPANPHHWTERLWVYDLRTNQNFTLRTNPLTRAHLDDFVACYHAENRHQRQESERFRSFSYDELLKRDKVSLDLFWLRDESLEGADALASPDVLAASIVEDLQAALEQDGCGWEVRVICAFF